MISSMTGFGAADGLVGSARASVEIRSVNHRFFNPSLKLPSAFSRWEGEIRDMLRQKIARGHVTLVARIDRDESTSPVIDETRLAQYLTALKALQKKHKLAGELDLATLLKLPDVITAPSDEVDQKAGDAMVIADLDASLLADATGRMWIRARRPELYTPLTTPTGLECDTRTMKFKE